MNVMKRAHEIRRQAAKRWSCNVDEILFSECLAMAHSEAKEVKQDKVNLYGSEKQVDWATRIRSQVEETLPIIESKAIDYAHRNGLIVTPEIEDLLRSVRRNVMAMDRASWWINIARTWAVSLFNLPAVRKLESGNGRGAWKKFAEVAYSFDGGREAMEQVLKIKNNHK